jgi:5-(carboxyamino)imidazole ribonucleotide synthase
MIVGILGAGQLGRMLALAGYPLGLRFRFLEASQEAPAGMLAECLRGSFTDPALLERFAAGLEVVTYEFENVPAETARLLNPKAPVHPSPQALETAQDRLSEKTLFQGLAIPTPPFAAVDDGAGLQEALSRLGLPAVLKTRRFGYDGKGQRVLRRSEEVERAALALAKGAWLVEGLVSFEREVSLLGVRNRQGQTAFYPLVENHHQGGILRQSLPLPPCTDSPLQAKAERYALRILETLDYVGVLAVEFFQCGEQLLANEIAPRVHNSGHWTIEGAETSQFENHLRAVLGLPLGSTSAVGHSAMINLIGSVPPREAVLQVPGAHLHLYGKTPHRGRKLGHITVTAPDLETLQERLACLRSRPELAALWPA